MYPFSVGMFICILWPRYMGGITSTVPTSGTARIMVFGGVSVHLSMLLKMKVAPRRLQWGNFMPIGLICQQLIM
ncbi:hypothetical protein A3A14_02850 [Candidatus Daviesbacteria bacterium RIFCSPLOWO2_01_FULL_43_38]|nr:MAG: hypothetical protein A2874_03435 [Candidatus Daviesbacteria bacterium RIFCSPHIGHO2_01_FULL_43_17]OGE63568.1 MAG: hypothetical protein A3A14_02850 [Candidatus Daviesbacteria bacterium RIFCSPLOWO2_01_FULL_43_38]OGE69187.1 MAG: hypothetical protein A3J21_01535 [Candidatus Daviesbacteria bacterium RIFCSPLOWO2_02_FULL_43_11]